MSEWIKNENGSCPVRGDIEVEVKLKDGSTSSGAAENYLWSIVDDMGDIKEYRIIKDSCPLTRDEALAWLVENVKVWPEKENNILGCPNGWIWIPPNNGNYSEFFCVLGPNGEREALFKRHWQAAQPAPASNKPSWDDAPDGAKILVQQADGVWIFGSSSSAKTNSSGWECSFDGKWLLPIFHGDTNPNWRDTLEYRPTIKESLTVQDKQDDELQYVPKNLARIKQLHKEIELAKQSIETMKIELAERNKEVQDVLNYCKFNA